MSEQLKVTGRIKQIFPTETKSNFSFRILWLVIDEGSQYPQTIEIQFPQAKAELLDKHSIGQEVTVDFNMRGREWEKDGVTKVFNTVSAWKIASTGSGSQQTFSNNTTDAEKALMSDDGSSLPF